VRKRNGKKKRKKNGKKKNGKVSGKRKFLAIFIYVLNNLLGDF